jgi:DDE superfamily endonuclease
MNAAERQACVAAILWFFQTTSNNNIAVSLVAAASLDEEPKVPWRAYSRSKRFIDVWAPEEDGGISDGLFEFFTRFKEDEVQRLARLLNIPVKFDICPRTGYPNAATESPEDALLVFLWRSAHPLAFGHLKGIFGKSKPWLSRVWNGVLQHIWETFGSRIELDTTLLAPQKIEEYEAIFGFIDGTEVAICQHMTEDPSSSSSGHKKQDAIGHIAIVLPNGLLGSILSGIPAASGDATLCIQAQLGERLREALGYLPQGQSRFVYGDAAFGSQDHVLGPYKRSGNRFLAPTQGALNQWLSTRRMMVEHGFGGVKTNFKLLSLRTSLVAGSCPVSLYMPVFSFLYNCRICLRGGSPISERFGLSPPSIEEYVEGRYRKEGNEGETD